MEKNAGKTIAHMYAVLQTRKFAIFLFLFSPVMLMKGTTVFLKLLPCNYTYIDTH